MPTSDIETIAIEVMGREFEIKCPKEQISELHKVSNYLNSKMQEVQRGNKLSALDHVAITAALNISHELFTEKQQAKSNSCDVDSISRRLLGLQQKINQALSC